MIIFSGHTSEYITLSFNMTLLGLLLARLLVHVQSSHDTDIFFTETIRLLSHAYHLSSGEDVTFVVNDPYVPHWECVEDLWMLSMQSMLKIHLFHFFHI